MHWDGFNAESWTDQTQNLFILLSGRLIQKLFLKSQGVTEKVVAAARNGQNKCTYNYRDSKTHLDLKSGISEGGTDDAKSYTNK